MDGNGCVGVGGETNHENLMARLQKLELAQKVINIV